MNVALPALIVFLLLLPGFIFRSRLKRVERTSLDYSPFGHIVAEAVMWAVAAHLVWIGFVHLLSYRIEASVVFGLLGSDPGAQTKAAQQVAGEFTAVSAYFVTLLFASYAVPSIGRTLVERYRLDRESSPFSRFFRFHGAPWYYLLTSADFDEGDEPDFIVISAIVDVAGAAVLYVGVLDEFFVDLDGRLDRLVLQGVSRRPISSDKPGAREEEQGARFYEIEGDYFVLRYSEAITLNVQYVRLSLPTEPSEVPR